MWSTDDMWIAGFFAITMGLTALGLWLNWCFPMNHDHFPWDGTA